MIVNETDLISQVCTAAPSFTITSHFTASCNRSFGSVGTSEWLKTAEKYGEMVVNDGKLI